MTDFAAVRAILDAATAGEWKQESAPAPRGGTISRVRGGHFGIPETVVEAREADARAIVTARNLLPELLAVAEAAAKELAEFDYWTGEPRPAVDGGTVRLHNFTEVQPPMEWALTDLRDALDALDAKLADVS